MKKIKSMTIDVPTFVCDICGSENALSKKCKLCGKDLCNSNKCGKYYSLRGWDDSPDVYCINCWEIGEHYRTEVLQLNKKHDEDLDRLETEWFNAVNKGVN
jgi:hypothetical protein